jgi:hypothetical protein
MHRWRNRQTRLSQIQDVLRSNRRRCTTRNSQSPNGGIGRHRRLKSDRYCAFESRLGHHTQCTVVSPSWWNGRHTCLRNRRASIPSSNLGEGTIHHSRLAQRESGCLTSSGSAVQSCHRLPVTARWPRGSRQLPAKQPNRWFESSSRVHPFIFMPS